MDDCPNSYPLFSGQQCPCCEEGELHAYRDGFGEVDCYICDTCYTWAYVGSDDMDPNEGDHYEEGDACDPCGLFWWQFNDERREKQNALQSTDYR